MGIYHKEKDGLWVTVYTGDRAILLAFDLPENQIDQLAGFSISCTLPDTGHAGNGEYFLPNRLNFKRKVSAETPFGSEQWTSSDKAPFQTFHWTHYPSTGPGQYVYTVFAAYFKSDTALAFGPSVSVTVDLLPERQSGIEIGFTRSMVSSQAYVNRFHNKELYPDPQIMDFDTTPYLDQYVWLGAHARETIATFLKGCQNDKGVTLDVFSFDFDEPDIIRALCSLGRRVRVFQDNSTGHCWPGCQEEDMMRPPDEKDKRPPQEPDTVKALRNAGVEVRTGHFSRLSHNKVMIRRRDGAPEAVLTGSANFTVRGLYVQANSVLLFEQPGVAELYAKAFDQAWNKPRNFSGSPIAGGWHDVVIGATRYSFSFAPHRTPFPLETIAEAIKKAEYSVLFAMMEMNSKGEATDAIKGLPEREDLYSMGVIEGRAQLRLFKPDTGKPNFTAASKAYLKKDVPAPFDKEIGGGSGKVIHHKFVVCDFNGDNPVVFCGSSNLAAGGETSNGDNLIAIHDRNIAVQYAIEAIRLYDHFRFRSMRETSTKAKPLQLNSESVWLEPYYDPSSIKYRERIALARPAGKLGGDR